MIRNSSSGKKKFDNNTNLIEIVNHYLSHDKKISDYNNVSLENKEELEAKDPTTLYINCNEVYFDKNKIANINKLNYLDNTSSNYRLKPLNKNNGNSTVYLNCKKQRKAKNSNKNYNNNNNNNSQQLNSEHIKMVLEIEKKNKPHQLDPIQHARLAFYESLLSKNSKQSSLRNYKIFDMLNNSNSETINSIDTSSLNEFVDSSLDLSGPNSIGTVKNLDSRRRVSINHFSKLDQLSNKRMAPITTYNVTNSIVSANTSINMEGSFNRLSIIPEISELNVVNNTGTKKESVRMDANKNTVLSIRNIILFC